VCTATGSVPDARVVVIGGTGRVGSSTASALLKEFPNLKVTVASRSDDSYQAAVSRRPELSKASFQRVDITNADSVKVRTASTVFRQQAHFVDPNWFRRMHTAGQKGRAREILETVWF
jgi:nucleoside-diphosphate-sugar epimerase